MKLNWLKIVLVLLLVLAVESGCRNSQSRDATLVVTSDREISSSDLSNSATQIIHPGDAVAIDVQGLEQTNSRSRLSRSVSKSGFVNLPQLGPVRIGGMTESDAAVTIDQQYRNSGQIENAKASVRVTR